MNESVTSFERLRFRFPVYGESVPTDHGEPLYAAISSAVPELHELDGFGISPILQAEAVGSRLMLSPVSHFYIQAPSTHIPLIVSLAGKTYHLRGNLIRVRSPSISVIQPAPILHSRYVTVKHAVTAEDMEASIQEQLQEYAIGCTVNILRRRVMTIHGRKVVGFGVLLQSLSDEASLHVQVQGIGGRRRFGGGIFLPSDAREG